MRLGKVWWVVVLILASVGSGAAGGILAGYLQGTIAELPATPPSVTTSTASNLITTGARLNGNLTSPGTASSVNVAFQWGTSSGVYPNTMAPQAMNTTGTFYFDLTGLTPGVTYYYRAQAIGQRTGYGAENNFTTLTTPSVTTSAASNITTTGARLNGNLASLGTVSSVNVSFQWGTSPGVYPNTTTPQAMNTTGVFHFDLTGLAPGVTYYYTAQAVGNGTGYGTENSFTMLTTPPSVTTSAASNLTTTGARLNGNLASLGTASSVNVAFQWGTSPGVYPNTTASQAMDATGAFYFDLGGLTPGVTYYFKAQAVGQGTTYGAENSFTTLTTPSVTTNAASNLTTTGARLNGNLTSPGTASSVNVSFQWGTSSGVYPNTTTPQAMDATGAFYFDLTGLAPGVTYYYRAQAVGQGTTYGAENNFTTLTTPPNVTTNAASNITTTGARLNGNLASLGTASSVDVAFQWGTSSGVYPNTTAPQAMNTTGVFHFDLTGLAPGVTYYYTAQAVGNGTGYGTENSFTTLTTPPSVTTNAADITTTGARLNGYLTSPGTASSVNVSFQWGTSSGIYPNTTAPQAMNTTGTFYFDLSGLTPGVTYYYRAQAVGQGTTYGAEKSFSALAMPPSVTTCAASNLTTTGARLNGNLPSLGTALSVNVSFQWGTSPGVYPNTTTPQAMNTTGTFYFDLTGLTPGITYYYRAQAVGHGTTYGVENSFITSVTTSAASNIITTGARLNGYLTSLGTASSVSVFFQWGTSPGVYDNTTPPQAMNTTGTFCFDLSGLTPGVTYYYTAQAAGYGYGYGVEKSFTTARS